MNAVHIDQLGHTYPASGRNGSPTKALSDIRLSVESGELFALLGPNGGGKTTLFRILSTALGPTQGSAKIFDHDVEKQTAAVREKIGVVFQNPSLDKKLTLKENLVHQGHLYGLSGAALATRIDEVLSQFQLDTRQNQLVEQLSGGLQRRVEIAKGLLHKPALLLLDEPSTGLDPSARRDMWVSLLQLKKEGTTILFTTHLMDEGEKADRVAILDQGHIRALGSPAELINRIGGDVISIQAADPAALSDKIKQKFGGSPTLVDGILRIEKKSGHQFIPQVVEAFPGLIQSIKMGKPNLEDVFVHETGHRL